MESLNCEILSKQSFLLTLLAPYELLVENDRTQNLKCNKPHYYHHAQSHIHEIHLQHTHVKINLNNWLINAKCLTWIIKTIWKVVGCFIER